MMILQKMHSPVGKEHSIRKLPNFLESLSQAVILILNPPFLFVVFVFFKAV